MTITTSSQTRRTQPYVSYPTVATAIFSLLLATGCSDTGETTEAGEPEMAERNESTHKTMSSIPASFVGRWAEKKEWCTELNGRLVVHVKPRSYSAQEGGGEVSEVKGDSESAKVTIMFWGEGMEEPGVDPLVFEFVRLEEDSIRMKGAYSTREMVRCSK